MAAISIYLRPNESGNLEICQVYLTCYIQRQKVRFNTGIRINRSQIDEKGVIHGKNAKEYNAMVDACKTRITEIMLRYQVNKIALTATQLKKEYELPDMNHDFYMFMNRTISELTGVLATATIQQHNSIYGKLKQFKPTLRFADINEEFIAAFSKYCKLNLKNSNNTISKNVKVIKYYMNLAVKRKIIHENTIQDVKSRRELTERVHLTEPEIKKLIELYNDNYLSSADQYALRKFLFMCLTGIRISDANRITLEQIHGDTLVFIPHKTREIKSTILRLPLMPRALEFVKDEVGDRKYGVIFKKFSEQFLNRTIKKIASMVDVNKPITSHSARHTYATLFLEKTSDVATLQVLLGHTDIRTTMVYVHISEGKKHEQVMDFYKRLSI